MATVQRLVYRFTLDAYKNGVQRVLQGFQTGESVSRHMEISLVSGSLPYELPLDNITASMYVKRPSQTSPSINACTIDGENNKILYDITDDDISEAGIVKMQLKIFDEETVLISPTFGMEVWESEVEDSEAEDTQEYTALTQALAAAEAMKDSAIAELYLDENNIFTVVFGDGTEYTSSVIADAIAALGNVEGFSLKAEGYAVGTQDGEPVTSESPYYHDNAKYHAEQAALSALTASNHETNAGIASASAQGYASDALGYKNDAKDSKDAAAGSASDALGYKNDAKDYKDLAVGAASDANGYATAASGSASDALGYKNDAKDYKDAAAGSASDALGYKNAASGSASDASGYATAASGSATTASGYATTATSYAVGGTGTRTGEDNDNAKYYKEQCEQIAAGIAGGLLPMGTVLFANLPTTGLSAGMMYNISDSFTSDSRFKDGGGKTYPAGTNAYVTADIMWDCFAGALITVNNKTGQSITLDGSDIKATGYTKAQAASAIAATDSLNEALGKLEYKADNVNIGVASFNGRTGAVTPSNSDYVGSDIKLTGYAKASSASAIAATDTVNQGLGKLEKKVDDIDVGVTSFNGRTGAVTPSNADYVGSDIKLTGYSKAQASSAIAATDTANDALGKLEYKADANASNITSLLAAVGVWTSVVNKVVGDTSCTFSNANIHTTSTVEARCENSSGTPITVTSYTTTEGQCVIAFDALEEATSFKLWIRNI